MRLARLLHETGRRNPAFRFPLIQFSPGNRSINISVRGLHRPLFRKGSGRRRRLIEVARRFAGGVMPDRRGISTASTGAVVSNHPANAGSGPFFRYPHPGFAADCHNVRNGNRRTTKYLADGNKGLPSCRAPNSHVIVFVDSGLLLEGESANRRSSAIWRWQISS